MAYCAAVGDILDVSALVENTGQASGDQDIYFYRDDAQFGLVGGVQLNEGESQTVSSTLDTSSLSPGTYVIKVQSADNSDVFEFDLVDPTNTAFYLVDIASTNEPVDPGETFEITATIRNVGDQDGTQDIVFSTNGTTRDTISGKQITAGSQDQVTLSWSVTQSDVGDYTANVSTADCEDTQDIVIGASAFFDVTITSTNTPVTEGETLEVTAELSNTGNDTGTQDITLDVGGTQRDSFLGYFLEPGQTETETFRWFTEDGDAGDYTATVSSDDDSDTASVTVEDPTGTGVSPSWSYTLGQSGDATFIGGVKNTIATVQETGSFSDGFVVGIDSDGNEIWDVTTAGVGFNLNDDGNNFYLTTRDASGSGNAIYALTQNGSLTRVSAPDDEFSRGHNIDSDRFFFGNEAPSGSTEPDAILSETDGTKLAEATNAVDSMDGGYVVGSYTVIVGSSTDAFLKGWEIVPVQNGVSLSTTWTYQPDTPRGFYISGIDNGAIYGLIDQDDGTTTIFGINVDDGSLQFETDTPNNDGIMDYYATTGAIYTSDGSTISGYNPDGQLKFTETISGSVKDIARADDVIAVQRNTNPVEIDAFELLQ